MEAADYVRIATSNWKSCTASLVVFTVDSITSAGIKVAGSTILQKKLFQFFFIGAELLFGSTVEIKPTKNLTFRFHVAIMAGVRCLQKSQSTNFRLRMTVARTTGKLPDFNRYNMTARSSKRKHTLKAQLQHSVSVSEPNRNDGLTQHCCQVIRQRCWIKTLTLT